MALGACNTVSPAPASTPFGTCSCFDHPGTCACLRGPWDLRLLTAPLGRVAGAGQDSAGKGAPALAPACVGGAAPAAKRTPSRSARRKKLKRQLRKQGLLAPRPAASTRCDARSLGKALVVQVE